FLNHADISDTATFIGIGRSFQLWNPQAYKSRESKSRDAARNGKMPKLILNPRPTSGGGA
ncbi:MAG: division/cell wall cluster transcriptional repressor MraZ, partial [Candidatus Puniceispirillales bacterium]